MLLSSNNWKDIVELFLTEINVAITREVKEELDYRYPDRLGFLDYVTILPKIEIDYMKYELDGFDKADASLIEYHKREDAIIVTEDHPLIALGVTDKLDIIQLIDFFVICYIENLLSKNDIYKLVRELREMKNITKRKRKDVLELIK